MLVSEQVPLTNHAEVVHPGHPPIIDTARLKDSTAKLKAGTVLKLDTSNGTLEPAAPADRYPAAVLVQDSDGVNAEVLVLWHGMVVFGRLLDSSGANPVAITAAAANRLRDAGIYSIQLFTSAKKG